MKTIIITLLLLFVVALPHLHADEIDTTPVKDFDLKRYMGVWHEVARLDNKFERHLTDVTAEYLINGKDCDVTVINRGYNSKRSEWREAIGRAHITDTRGRLKVSFFIFTSTEYNIMALGKNYEWALVGTKSSKYLWILSRIPEMPTSTLNEIITIAQQRGYNTDELLILPNITIAELEGQ
ncbi:MAG: lipocalin family protein [Rikenellaceae bacterium]